MMNWTIKTKDNKIYVTLTVTHIKKIPQGSPRPYETEFVLAHLNNEKIAVGNLIKDDVVYNYQAEKSCSGTWVFSLPPKPKPKKPPKPIEKKENVLKMTNKKTIKK